MTENNNRLILILVTAIILVYLISDVVVEYHKTESEKVKKDAVMQLLERCFKDKAG